MGDRGRAHAARQRGTHHGGNQNTNSPLAGAGESVGAGRGGVSGLAGLLCRCFSPWAIFAFWRPCIRRWITGKNRPDAGGAEAGGPELPARHSPLHRRVSHCRIGGVPLEGAQPVGDQRPDGAGGAAVHLPEASTRCIGCITTSVCLPFWWAALLLVFEKMNYQYITVTKKVMFIAVLVVTFQFLDIMPAANGLPMGRGEISGDVKLASEILGANTAMNAMAAAGLVVFLLMLVLLFFQLRVENNLRQLNILREQNLAIRTEARMNEMKNRTYREMQYLVHDLKSPLASAQTLVGVIKMECEAEGRTQDVEYLSRIEGAVEQMNRMISEILYEEQATPETVERLVDRALAQLSVESYAACVHTELKTPGGHGAGEPGAVPAGAGEPGAELGQGHPGRPHTGHSPSGGHPGGHGAVHRGGQRQRHSPIAAAGRLEQGGIPPRSPAGWGCPSCAALWSVWGAPAR